MLYKDIKKQYDSFTWTAEQQGIHTFCFSNEFSTFTHKVVYFDLEVGDERPAVEEMGSHHTAMTLVGTDSSYKFTVSSSLFLSSLPISLTMHIKDLSAMFWFYQ